MLHYNESIVCVAVCYLILMLAGAVHIAYGSYFIELGAWLRENHSNEQQLYLDNLPQGSFAITIGIFMILAVIGLRLVIKYKLGTVGEFLVWITTWLICIFNFALALLEIRMYVFQEQSFTKFGLSIPTQTAFTVPYYMELADGIFSFVIVFPVTLYLVYLANFRMVDSQLRNLLYIRADSEQKEDIVVLGQEREAAVETD